MQNFPMNQMPQTGAQPHMQPGTPAQQHMQPGMMDPSMQQHMYELCQQYHHHMMQFQTADGQTIEGIIDGVDREGVNLLVPVGDTDDDQGTHTDFRYGYGGFPGYGFPRRFRRFRRQHFPFFFLRRLFFPFFY
jgi:hypothetical protein